ANRMKNLKTKVLLTLFLIISIAQTSSLALAIHSKTGTDEMSPQRVAELTALNQKAAHPRFFVPADGKNEYEQPFAKSDNGYQTEMHKKNVAKVVFGTAKVDPAAGDGQLKNTFGSEDNIYAHVFLEATPENYILYYSKKPGDVNFRKQNRMGMYVV